MDGIDISHNQAQSRVACETDCKPSMKAGAKVVESTQGKPGAASQQGSQPCHLCATFIARLPLGYFQAGLRPSQIGPRGDARKKTMIHADSVVGGVYRAWSRHSPVQICVNVDPRGLDASIRMIRHAE